MPVSKLGPQPMAPQVHQPKPTQQQQQQHQQQQPTRQPQQKEHYYSGSLYARDRGKVQETMQKQGYTGTLQMHQHTKDTFRQPQGQGPQKQSNRSIPGPSRKLCSYVCKTQHSTETWGSTNSHTYGTIFYMHLLHYSTSLPAPPSPPKSPLLVSTPPHPPLVTLLVPHCPFRWGAHIFLVSVHTRSNTTPNTPKSPKTTPPTAVPSW